MATGLTVGEARTALRGYRVRIDKIVSLIPEGFVKRETREHARELAKKLKADVTEYYKRPAISRHSMSQVELNFFDPCMDRVFVALQGLRTGTTPGPVWRSALYNADTELSHWLYQLEPK